MTVGNRSRAGRVARLAGLLLVAVALPVTGPLAAPAHAEEGCTTEEPPSEFPPDLPPSWGCDDTTPPDTAITAMSPKPNRKGLTRSSTMSFDYTEVVADEDAGPWGFMCKLVGPAGVEQTHDWEDCQSATTQTYTGLPDGKYTFSVYAVDEGDSAILFLGMPIDPTDDESASTPDDDSITPATRTWTQDTTRPSVLVYGGPYDRDGTGLPLSRSPRVSYLLDSEPGVRYRCTLDGRRKKCGKGRVEWASVGGGLHTFEASVVDAAGNRSVTVSRNFLMPFDLSSDRGWHRERGKGWFDRDVIMSNRPGERLTFRSGNIRGLVLIAPSGPKLGKLRLRIGNGVIHTVNLGAKPAKKQRHYVIRGRYAPLVTGQITIESLVGKPVQVDALYFPIN